MRLIKKVLALSLVTALTFTSFEMPVHAVANTNVENEVNASQSDTQDKEVAGLDETQMPATQENANDNSSNETVGESTTTEGSTTAVDEKTTDGNVTTEETKKDADNTTTTEDSKKATDNETKTEKAKEISKIQKKLNEALMENGTVSLSEDIQLEDTLQLTLPTDLKEASVTLDLNGHKISAKEISVMISVAENVILNIKGEGSITSDVENGFIINNEGTVKLDHADLLATGSKSVGVLNNSILGEKGLIIKSGTIKADWFAVGRTAKAEVSRNRPTAFFAAAGIVLPSDKKEVEQGTFSVDENATVIDESSNNVEVSEKTTQPDKTTDTETSPTDTTTTKTEQEVTNPTQNSPITSNPEAVTTELPAQQATETTVVAPEVPVDVTATVNGYNSVTISWSAAKDAQGYIVERIQPATESTYVELTKTTQTTYIDSSVLVGKEYKYHVYAYKSSETNELLKSIVSSDVTARTTIVGPQNLGVSQSSATALQLSWNGVEGALKYNIYRSSKDGDFKLLTTVDGIGYKDSGLKTGTKYAYKVTAVNGDFESEVSNVASAYAAAKGATKLKASSDAYNKMNLSWKKAKGATKYVIYRSTNQESGYKKIKTVTSTKHTDTVKTGVTYYYKVVSYSGKAKGGESAIASGVAVSAAPTNVKVVVTKNSSAKITWSKSKGAGSYNIYRSTSKKSGYTLIKTVSSKKSSFTDKTVTTGTFYYKVSAVTKNVEGKMSKVASVKIKPAAVKDLKINSAGGKNVTLNWSGVAGATSYEVYRSTSESKGYSKIGSTTELTFTNNKLKNGKTYYYRVYTLIGSTKSDYKQVSYVNPSKVYLSSSSLYIESGESAKLTVSFKPSSVSDGSITWSSANEKVATVTKKGVVYAVAAGVTTISATSVNGVTATCEVNVDQEEKGVIVVLDPGHGGSDGGNSYGGIKEKDVNLKISQYTKAELEKYSGIIVRMTRTDDTYLDLEERTEIAKRYKADMFISQHNNAATTSSANGAEVFVSLNPAFNAQSTRLGSLIMNRLIGLGLTNRGVKTRQGENGDYYSVIRNSVKRGFPGIIVESAFLSNAEDREFLSQDANLKAIGVSTATAIAEYYGLSKK